MSTVRVTWTERVARQDHTGAVTVRDRNRATVLWAPDPPPAVSATSYVLLRQGGDLLLRQGGKLLLRG